MEDTKVKAIVIDSKDYKDNDKLVTLFTLEKGLVTAIAKSVKTSKAKLKFVKEPFCFGDFVLAGNNQIKTIASVSVIDTFFDIVAEINRFYLASAVLSIIKEVVNFEEANPNLFLLSLNAFKMFAYEKATNPKLIFCKYLINVFDNLGYRINFYNCANCKGDFLYKRYLNFNSGEIVCSKCKSDNSVLINDNVLDLIKNLSLSKFDELIKIETTQECITKTIEILLKNFEFRFMKKIKIEF